jgi:adhesin transport system outer membrane protein
VSYQKIIIQLFFASLSSFAALDIYADDYNKNPVLSVDMALALALKTHPLILSAEGQFQAAKSELNASRWSRFPTVSAGTQENADKIKQNTTTVNLPLWAGGRINAEIDLAKSVRDGALSGVSEAQQTVMLETVSQFFDYFKSEKKLQISRDNVDEHQRLYEIIERRVAAATSPDVDSMLALARLQYARSAEIQSKTKRNIAKSSLELLIDKVVDAVKVFRRPEPFNISIDDALSIGILVSPKIARIKSEADGFEANVRSARSVLYPQVSLGYEYGKTHGGISDGLIDKETFVTVQFQPGAGLSVASSVTAAKQRKLAALDTLEAEKRELRRQIKFAWNEYVSASIQLEPSKMLVEATGSVVESYLRQYAVGKKSWLDVLNAQREATQAKNTLVDYEVLYLTSLYRLKIILNEINPNRLGA